MNKMFAVTLGALAGTMLMSSAVPAQEVTIVGEPCPLPVLSERPDGGTASDGAEQAPADGAADGAAAGQADAAADGAADSTAEGAAGGDGAAITAVESFIILGRAGSDYMLILTGDGEGYKEGYVETAVLERELPEIDCAAFPDLDEMEAVPVGSQGEGAELVQRVLASEGLLSGPVDGKYGNGTAEAVRQFQAAYGLEATGSADEKTMLLINSILQGIEESIEVTYPSYTTAEEKFGAIFGETDAELDAFMNTKWRFVFDAFEDEGVIDPGTALGTFAVDGADIDKISGEVFVKVQVARNEDTGYYGLTPVLVVETTGAYRPYLQGAVLAGERTVKLEGGTSSGHVEGTALVETGLVPVTEEGVLLLSEGGVTTIRVLGKNTNFDVNVDAGAAEKLTAFLEACAGLY